MGWLIVAGAVIFLLVVSSVGKNKVDPYFDMKPGVNRPDEGGVSPMIWFVCLCLFWVAVTYGCSQMG